MRIRDGRQRKVERSMSFSTRIDLLILAELSMFFNARGNPIRSMSQLISDSVNGLWNVLESNGRFEENDAHVESVVAAHNYLESTGLITNSMRNRNAAKLAKALGYENLRDEGVDPKDEDPEGYAKLHNQPRTYGSQGKKVKSSVPRKLTEEELDE